MEIKIHVLAAAAYEMVRKAENGQSAQPALAMYLKRFSRERSDLWPAASCPLKAVKSGEPLEELESIEACTVAIITSYLQSEGDVRKRAIKARNLGAPHVLVMVPHLVRVDCTLEYVDVVDGVFFCVPWVGEPGDVDLPAKLYELHPSAASLIS